MSHDKLVIIPLEKERMIVRLNLNKFQTVAFDTFPRDKNRDKLLNDFEFVSAPDFFLHNYSVPGFIDFKLSESWLPRFKRKYRIRSRTITYTVSKISVREKEEREMEAKLFVENFKVKSKQYSLSDIYNTDQSGWNQLS